MLSGARVTQIESLEGGHDTSAGRPSTHATGVGASSAIVEQTTAHMNSTARDGPQDAASPSQPADQRPEEDKEVPIEDVVNKAIIHANKPIENLPLIAPPELKLIGRCVTFKGDTTVDGETRSFFYEGLVATINKETVMLIHVHRYTEEDFQLHKLQLRHSNNGNGGGDIEKGTEQEPREGGGGSGGGHTSGADNGLNMDPEPPAATREEREASRYATTTTGGAASRANGNDFDFDHLSNGAGMQQMEEPQLLNDLGETHAEATTRVRNRMRGHQGSMGPIPYVTFSRSHIHRVEFGVDPRSSFYSIFQDPTKLYFDMQCLRMFVRRYLIHTSQGNNPRLVPLRAFVTCRCNCPNLDHELLVQTTREELAHLIKIDRDVRRAKKKKDQGRRNALRTYRAPNGLFRLTGVLYLTHLPRQTFTIGAMEMIVMLFVLAYEIVTGMSTEMSVVAPYVVRIYPYVFATIVVGLMATGCTLLHSVRMSLPLASQLYLIVIRGLFTFGAVACSIMTMIVAGEMANLNRWIRFYERELPQEQLCYFYGAYHCSGIFESCVTAFNSSECQCALYTTPDDFFSPTCDAQLVMFIQRTTIPLVCMSFVVFVTYLFDGYLHLRLFHIARLLERRM